jgi:hypothetical protein
MPTTIDPTTLLQVDGSVIVGIFVFLTILEYTGRKPDSTLETKQKKEKFRFPSSSGLSDWLSTDLSIFNLAHSSCKSFIASTDGFR